MGLFSGTSGRNAAIYSAGLAQQNQNTINDILAAAQNNALGQINNGLSSSLGALSSGYSNATDQYNSAISRLNPWTNAGTGALSTYQNAIGLNGTDGNSAATSTFQASPGYRYSVDQATDAVARKQSALGMLGSGNTAQAISDRAQNMANQEWGSWLDRLNGLSSQGQQSATTQSGLQSSLGNLYAQQGRDTSGLYTNAATNSANTITGTGNSMANAQQQFGNTIQSLAGSASQAGSNAAANRLGALVNAGSTFSKLLGSLAGSY
jgi:hypothetical protein